nr:hypothetical protein [Hyphomonas sp.]
MSQDAQQVKPAPRLVVGGGRGQHVTANSGAPQNTAAPSTKPQPDAMGVFVGLEMEARQCRDVE